MWCTTRRNTLSPLSILGTRALLFRQNLAREHSRLLSIRQQNLGVLETDLLALQKQVTSLALLK
jgi:hypothetical protein